MTALDTIVTVGLFAAVALLGLALWFDSRPSRAELAHQARLAEIEAEQERAWKHAANVGGFGVLGKEANR